MIPGNQDDGEDESRADVSGEIRLPATLEATGPVPARAEIAIVGGGVMGLAIAYYLAQRGLEDVVVLERGYLAEGASGRNGGGVRQQWSTEINIRLMQESVELCRRFAVDVGVNAGASGTDMLLVVMYPWPVYGGPLGLDFANLGNGKMLMTSTQVFRIEPL